MPIAPQFSLVNLSEGQAPWLSLPSLKKDSKTIHMSAANGFTTACYLSFLRQFNNEYSITGMDCRGIWKGHETPPRNFTLHDFANDLIQSIEIKHSSPVIGMGHSLGGSVSLIAAIKRPDLFSHLVLIEPASLPSRWVDLIYPYIPKDFLFNFVPFIKGSLNRQQFWQSPEAFYARYRQHNTFKHFTNQSFNDYISHGLTKKEDQWQLRFAPQWEAHIFCVIEFIWKYLFKISIPTLFVRAEHSKLYSHEQFTRYNKNLPTEVDCREINGAGHLLPQEAPDQTGHLIIDWLSNNISNNC